MSALRRQVPRPAAAGAAATLVLAVLLAVVPTAAARAQVPLPPVPPVGPLPGQQAPADQAAPAERDPATPALTTPYRLVDDRAVADRLPQPEDRYALAGGCYAIEVPDAGWVTRQGGALGLAGERAQAEPFHVQATRLGEYLLATNEGPETRWEDAWWDVRGYLAAETPVPEASLRGTGLPTPGEGLLPNAPLPTLPTTGDVHVAEHPSRLAEWRIVAAGDDPDRKLPGSSAGRGLSQTYRLQLPASGEGLRLDGSGLSVADGDGTPVRFHHVATGTSNGTSCAVWPEIDTDTSGRPEPTGKGPADRVEGFFEAHVHGMAFEFLGGELRCGRPWHPYGVEYALGNCLEEGNPLNSVLEVAVSGASPTDPVLAYDPVGWPTFSYWPQHRTLTHEQFYWRWLERAYHGGLRLMTNLLVDNTALCQVFPFKRNSCNEMDGVRLQAQRLFELQDYIDAQSGGPGEGWLRIVTSPTQAREVINAGRLAVVLGIEVSVLFDCGEILDQPQCTKAQIDERLQEVFDMGVRQMELINKFDNALSGVTGDGGTTGVVVNQGNRLVTGHYWDMVTCEDDGHDHDHGLDGHQHDKRQMNARDDVPGADREEIDVLAGAVLDLFGPTRGYAAPVYPEGPHCNTRGLTDLGAYVIEQMIAKGMIFDPDHMSALAQRQALDLIEHDLIPAEEARAAAEGRPAIQPAVMSSHSWANDVIYQRIYRLDGVVAPRTDSADGFVRSWIQHRDWAAAQAPNGYEFGMGYGADTNGLGGQPPPRRSAAQRVDYATSFEAPIGGVRIEQHTSGFRTFDVNAEGVAHYGMFADWFHELTLAADELAQERGGGTAIVADMLAGAETYLQLWERAVYGGNSCVEDQSRPHIEDVHALLGADVEGFLRAIGQPISRDGAAYVYCVDAPDGTVAVVDVRFDEAGRAAEVAPGSTQSWLLAAKVADHAHHGHGSHSHALPRQAGAGDGAAPIVLLLAMALLALRFRGPRRALGVLARR
jgi:hypothetical protein